MAGLDPTGTAGRRWLHWADQDLVAARHNAADLEITPRVACGLAQQAAEKGIKAVLAAIDVDPPKSHNLLRLARLLPRERVNQFLDVGLEELTRWAIEGRYPENLDEATANDATRAVALAGQVVALAHHVLEERGGDA